jgi:hypothetical protein
MITLNENFWTRNEILWRDFFATFGNNVLMLNVIMRSVKFLIFWVSFWHHFWCLYHLISFSDQQNSCNDNLEQKLLDTKWNSLEGNFFATCGNNLLMLNVIMLSVKILPFWVSFWRHFWCLYQLIFFSNWQNSFNDNLEQKFLTRTKFFGGIFCHIW